MWPSETRWSTAWANTAAVSELTDGMPGTVRLIVTSGNAPASSASCSLDRPVAARIAGVPASASASSEASSECRDWPVSYSSAA